MESAENREQSSKVNQPKPGSNDSPSLSKIETIRLLNDSIDRLESTIKEISQNSTKKLPSSESINTLINTTQELADSVTPTVPDIKTVVEEIPSEEIKVIPPAKVRPPRPPSQAKQITPRSSEQTIAKSKQKQNRSLTVIGIIAIAIALIALSWFYLPKIKATLSPLVKTPQVAIERKIPDEPETVDLPVTNPPNNIDQTKPTEINLEPETPELIPIPQDLTSPGKAKNLKIKTIEPELTFTPEQSFVATLQTKLAEIINNYDADLFKTIQVDLPKSSLAIAITDSWYQLNESNQNKLANEILQRSRQLNFDKLQLQDAQGTIVARNPVVGDRAIIIRSSKND